jgi:endonuclease/exonuclease/phosphatase family metal-dependent hydrolase
VALQEIENQAIFSRLKQRLARVGCPYRYGVVTHQKRTAIQVALLSRFPIASSREIRVNYSPKDRNILEATLTIEGHPLTIFVNHWKSKSRSGKESRRIHYAKALMKRIASLPKEREYLITGDLNSHYDEFRVLNKRLDDSGGKTGINHILKSIEKGELISEKRILEAGEGRHYNLWLELTPSKRWSHKYYGRRGSIDHIILPSSLFDGKGIDYVNDSYGVFRPFYLFTRQGWINAWDYRNGKHTGRGYSDHLPIYARFDTHPYQPAKEKAIKEGRIADLYRVEQLDSPLRLKHAVVVLKRGANAILKQSPDGRAIFVYAAARALEEGSCYDLTVTEIATYKGLKEITRFEGKQKCGKVALAHYYKRAGQLDVRDPKWQGEVFVDLKGIYRHNHFEIDGRRIPIYFKNKRSRPRDGSRVLIHRAYLGTYRKPQLVVLDKRDFEVLGR